MPCFDPQDVIFITNKWDQIERNAEGSDENSSDEDDVTKTWETLKANIKHNWPSVKEENIYKMNLRNVSINYKIDSKMNYWMFKMLRYSFSLHSTFILHVLHL